MTIGWQEQLRPGVALRGILQEATAALISMDAARLDELARCCADLNRELHSGREIAETAVELQGAAGDLKLLNCVLFETRANLTVLSRLLALRQAGGITTEMKAEQSSYRPDAAGGWQSDGCQSDGWQSSEGRRDYGDN
jgi:hypothetical protein